MAKMNNESTINQLLADAAEKIKREAYQAGWRDAVAALNKAAADAAELDPGDLAANSNFSSRPVPSANGLTQGSTPWFVFQAVSKKPGMTGSELVSYVQEGGHKVSEGSIRTTLVRLKHRKLVASRHGKWFPE